MKYKKITLIIIINLLILSICINIYVTSHTFKYDNNQPISEVSNKRYSKEDIYKLENAFSFSNIYVDYPFWEFNLKYKPEIIRKTSVGYYAILLHEDDSLCFVFWNFENKIYSIYRTRGFVSSEEFKNTVSLGKTTFNEMKERVFDFFVYPSSKKIATAHLCIDGIIVVEYDDYLVAESFEFYSNEKLTEKNNDFINIVPYILPTDKINLSEQSETITS